MSRRRNNAVRGPTSALTDFLRESGIDARTIARRVATQNVQEQEQDEAGPSNAAVGPSTAQGEEGGEDDNAGAEVEQAEASTSRARTTRANGYTSDQLDDPEEEAEASPAKKRRTNTRAAKAKAKKKAKDDGDYEGSSEDEYKALSKSLYRTGAGRKPDVGNIENCAKCQNKFTVTKYTMAANPGPGWLCHKCAKASGIDPFKKPAVPRKRNRADKREVVHYEERRFPSLASICIQLISKYIDDVEGFGDIGSVNVDELAKALAKNRGLTPQNAHLFYDVQNTKVSLYDATNLTPDAFITLSSLNPNLTTLHLSFCGRLDDQAMVAWTRGLPSLTHLDLLGPFLVRIPAWLEFIKSKPGLKTFRITQSPRFDAACTAALAEHCTQLEDLRLREIGKLSDDNPDEPFIEHLVALPQLKALDLSCPGGHVSEESLIAIMERHGPTLESLDLTDHGGVTNGFLLRGVRRYARRLAALTLDNTQELTDKGVARFFSSWERGAAAEADAEDDVEEAAEEDDESAMSVDGDDDDENGDVGADNGAQANPASTSPPAPALAPAMPTDPAFVPNPGLHTVSFNRNHLLSSASVDALISHSARTLEDVNLNGLKSASATSLARLKEAKELRRLDVGWCREMDDFVLKEVVDSCTKLKEVRVWGCSRVRGVGVKRRGVVVHGIEPNAG
ncbi:RNI-like protein [Coniophora puteana RWD-64-598 SS2]|uniref:RNI-like protein n=1 Tax=Coniophora puteana (strain RWD-64-598) TaxID=741705 RepID=A0A5M3MKJ1_CONPW|nr:RNI-like protein [Coniophora puteana RWD-64-598 SS2]EIW79061.1 RNI-like protein [Coniophora puteana RWD-64-598 SS2]